MVAACPPLGKTAHNDFGAVVQRLLEMYEQYDECRRAALAQERK